MGQLWWTAPSIFHVMGRGPVRLIKFSSGVPRPGPSIFHVMGRGPAQSIAFSKIHGSARPGPSDFQVCRPGPAHDIGGEARDTRAL